MLVTYTSVVHYTKRHTHEVCHCATRLSMRSGHWHSTMPLGLTSCSLTIRLRTCHRRNSKIRHNRDACCSVYNLRKCRALVIILRGGVWFGWFMWVLWWRLCLAVFILGVRFFRELCFGKSLLSVKHFGGFCCQRFDWSLNWREKLLHMCNGIKAICFFPMIMGVSGCFGCSDLTRHFSTHPTMIHEQGSYYCLMGHLSRVWVFCSLIHFHWRHYVPDVRRPQFDNSSYASLFLHNTICLDWSMIDWPDGWNWTTSSVSYLINPGNG